MTGSEILLIAIQAFGGVALFIYGMTMLGSGLEKNFGRQNGENSLQPHKQRL